MSLTTELQLMLDTYSEDFRARDVQACLAFFDEDCKVITPRGVFRGRSQVEQLHEFWIENHTEREMQVQQIDSIGDHVYAIWRFRDQVPDAGTGQSKTFEGTALGVIRLDPDHGWLIVACSSNLDCQQADLPMELTPTKAVA
ncbi:YybH family protein [Aliiruegeria sabulilitoris]|uniref:YybH family protein n=1 Tax=Aliiruegeria sabulilitoris TaxID=1510458 RepID=UPI000831F4A2|nr:nuclear transport factor 2 family protein [Aliiruegeria sabulilitoris]